ncbi:hypothetical protein ACFPRL_19680 [Pseudoclavibacter helvolus]
MNECPLPSARTDCPAATAARTTSLTSAVLAGTATRSASKVMLPAQLEVTAVLLSATLRSGCTRRARADRQAWSSTAVHDTGGRVSWTVAGQLPGRNRSIRLASPSRHPLITEVGQADCGLEGGRRSGGRLH